MMKPRKLIIISNKLPFKIVERKGVLEFSSGSGGLVSSIKSFVQKTSELPGSNQAGCPLWIGSSDITEAYFPATKGCVTFFE